MKRPTSQSAYESATHSHTHKKKTRLKGKEEFTKKISTAPLSRTQLSISNETLKRREAEGCFRHMHSQTHT